MLGSHDFQRSYSPHLPQAIHAEDHIIRFSLMIYVTLAIDETTNQWPFETIRCYAVHLVFNRKNSRYQQRRQIAAFALHYRYTFIFQAQRSGKIHR